MTSWVRRGDNRRCLWSLHAVITWHSHDLVTEYLSLQKIANPLTLLPLLLLLWMLVIVGVINHVINNSWYNKREITKLKHTRHLCLHFDINRQDQTWSDTHKMRRVHLPQTKIRHPHAAVGVTIIPTSLWCPVQWLPTALSASLPWAAYIRLSSRGSTDLCGSRGLLVVTSGINRDPPRVLLACRQSIARLCDIHGDNLLGFDLSTTTPLLLHHSCCYGPGGPRALTVSSHCRVSCQQTGPQIMIIRRGHGRRKNKPCREFSFQVWTGLLESSKSSSLSCLFCPSLHEFPLKLSRAQLRSSQVVPDFFGVFPLLYFFYFILLIFL